MREDSSNVIRVTFPNGRAKRRGLAIAFSAGDGCVYISASGRQKMTLAEVSCLIRDLRDVRDEAKSRSKV